LRLDARDLAEACGQLPADLEVLFPFGNLDPEELERLD
jgi:hypothetical protein